MKVYFYKILNYFSSNVYKQVQASELLSMGPQEGCWKFHCAD